MTARAEAAGEAPTIPSWSERFRLRPDELRFVADWLRLEDIVDIELPAEVADLLRQRRADDGDS